MIQFGFSLHGFRRGPSTTKAAIIPPGRSNVPIAGNARFAAACRN
jgi:hypothetical protein